MSIEIENLTLKQIREISNLVGKNNDAENTHWKIGEKYFVRTVTMHLVGKLIFINNKEIVLSDASWVADSGRFNDALKKGSLNEVEPFIDDVIVNREALVDATLWKHKLPTEQK